MPEGSRNAFSLPDALKEIEKVLRLGVPVKVNVDSSGDPSKIQVSIGFIRLSDVKISSRNDTIK